MKNIELFSNAINGYNKKEVVAYLEKLSADIEEIERDSNEKIIAAESECETIANRLCTVCDENEALKTNISELTLSLDECNKVIEQIKADSLQTEATLKAQIDALLRDNESLAAEKSGMIKGAEHQAKQIIEAAQAQAQAIIHTAQNNAKNNIKEDAEQKKQAIEAMTLKAAEAIRELEERSRAVYSGLEVSKRHIDAVNETLNRIICGE